MNYEQAVLLARSAAQAHLGEHSYLPADLEDMSAFSPHDWVIDAILAAAPSEKSFVQPKIPGYRQLGPREGELMSRAKRLEAEVLMFIEVVKDYHNEQRAASIDDPRGITETARLEEAQPERWLAMGRTDVQTAFMKIVRSIAQPQTLVSPG